MPLPIHLNRPHVRPPLAINSEAELLAWTEREEQGWMWLSELPQDDGGLLLRIQEAVFGPLSVLSGILQPVPGQALTEQDIEAAEGEFKSHWQDNPGLLSSDPEVKILREFYAQNPEAALGRLAQALGLAVQNESAAAMQGRLDWLINLPEQTRNNLDDQLANLQNRIHSANQQLDRVAMRHQSQEILRALNQVCNQNRWWVLGFMLAMLVWTGAAAYGAWWIHTGFQPSIPPASNAVTQPAPMPPASSENTGKPDQQPIAKTEPKAEETSSWVPAVFERSAFYLMLITTFSFVMRWLGRMMNDAWQNLQSFAQREAALQTVLSDERKELIKDDPETLKRIREEIFGDARVEKSDKEEPDLDVLKKVIGLIKEIQGILPDVKKG